MERLTAPATEALWQRLEALATELEHEPSAYAFSPWVLLAEAFAATRPPVATLPALRRSVALAHRLRAIRTNLLPHELPWRPLTDVLALVHTEATRLSTLYGVARPACLLRRREQRQAFHTAFTAATGTVYHTYDAPKTAKARTTITTFWADACTTALAAYQAAGTLEALDGVLAGLPAWSAQHPVRWGPRGWREPAPPEVMQRLTTYLRVWEVCGPALTALAPVALAAAPVVERAQVAPAIEAEYAAQLQPLRVQLSALPRPTDVPKTQHAQLRTDRAQVQQALDALLRAQEAAITRQVQHSANVRQKLATLVKLVQEYPETLLRKLGKASVDALPTIIWIYDWDRQGDDTWREAKREARRVVRQVRQAHAPTPAAAP
jgi:flagellar motility protein MotE (MotC chaperone)